ncbi:MAG TPA: hypothetical protein VKB37_09395 [Jatrophihabitantaceae bacterium]|nr:hypothetical protein [Jatrophihabitantaceae bacterium]
MVVRERSCVVLCVLLWEREGHLGGVIAYEAGVLPLMAELGGSVHRRFQSQGGTDESVEIQVLSFPAEENLTAYMNDERRSTVTWQRDRSVARTQVLRGTVI